MRALGFTDFNRRILYGRNEDGKYKPGWIEKYGWRHLPSLGTAAPRAGNAGAPACMSAKHEQPPVITPSRHNHGPTPPKNGGVAGGDAGVPGKDFPAWLKQVSPDLTWDWKYQKYIYQYLERITTGESKRLMIFLPPRHGKSELVTVRYAGWRLWNDPKMRIIVSSYNQTLADKFSRSIRRLLSEEEDKSEPPALAGGQSDGNKSTKLRRLRRCARQPMFAPRKLTRPCSLMPPRIRVTGRPLTQAVPTRGPQFAGCSPAVSTTTRSTPSASPSQCLKAGVKSSIRSESEILD